MEQTLSNAGAARVDQGQSVDCQRPREGNAPDQMWLPHIERDAEIPSSRRAARASLAATPGASRAIPASTTALAQSLCRAWIHPSDPARKRAQFKEIRRFPRRVGKEAGKNWSYQLRSLGDAIRCQKEYGRDEGGQTRAGVGFRCLACRNSQRQSRSGYAPE